MRLSQTLAWRTLTRNRTHSLLTILTIALTAGVMMGLQVISGAFIQYGNAVGSDIIRWARGAQMLLMAVVMVCTVPMIMSIYGFSAKRRTRQLALLATQGASPRMIRAQLRWEAIFMGLIGLGLGLPLGSLGAWIVMDLNLAESFRSFIGPNKPIPNVQLRVTDLIIVSAITALAVGLATGRTIRQLGYTAPLTRTTERPDAAHGLIKKTFKPLRGTAPEALARAQVERRSGNYRLLTVSILISMIFLLTVHGFVHMLTYATQAAYGFQGRDPQVTMTYSDWNHARRAEANIPSPYTDDALAATRTAYWDAHARYDALAEASHTVVFAREAAIDVQTETLGILGLNDADMVRLGLEVDAVAVVDDTRSSLTIEETEYDVDGNPVTHEMDVAITAHLDALPDWLAQVADLQDRPDILLIVSMPRVTELLPFSSVRYQTSYEFSAKGYEAFTREPRPESGSFINVSDPTQSMRSRAAGDHIMSLLSVGFVVLMTLVSVSGLVHALLSSFCIREPEIGILMSIGMTDRQLLQTFLWEGRLYVWKGLVIGGLIGLIIHRLIWWMQFGRPDQATYGSPLWAVPWFPVLAVILGVLGVVGLFAWIATRVIRQQRDWIRLIRKEH